MKNILCIVIMGAIAASCEQESFEPALNVEPGGGTLSTFKAYTIDSTAGNSIYGRVVFWLDNGGNTLIQISLNNTADSTLYSSGIFSGVTGGGGPSLVTLSNIDGGKGEFVPEKFFVVNTTDMFDQLDSYDAHINIFDPDGFTIVSTGNIGLNADPVDEGS